MDCRVRLHAVHALTMLPGGGQGARQPLFATAIHGVAIWVWHVPALFDAAATSDTVHALQHISFLGSALLFWWALLRARPSGRGIAVACLFVTALHTGLLGAS